MRYFIDTEFDDWKPWPILISIALVADDGREYYAEFADYDRASAKPWVAENVLPHLGPIEDAKPLMQIRSDVADFFLPGATEMWANVPHYDWVLFHHGLFENHDKVPEHIPFDCWDVRQLRHSLVGPPQPVASQSPGHHALVDARWVKAEYEHLSKFAAVQASLRDVP